jgi:hypothetical protein
LTVPLDQRTIGADHLAQSGDQPSCHLPAPLARAFLWARASEPPSGSLLLRVASVEAAQLPMPD